MLTPVEKCQMNCPDREELIGFYINNLESKRYVEIKRHVESCSECEGELNMISLIFDSVKTDRGTNFRRNCPGIDIIFDYCKNKLGKSEKDQVTKHLSFCPFCEMECIQLSLYEDNDYDSNEVPPTNYEHIFTEQLLKPIDDEKRITIKNLLDQLKDKTDKQKPKDTKNHPVKSSKEKASFTENETGKKINLTYQEANIYFMKDSGFSFDKISKRIGMPIENVIDLYNKVSTKLNEDEYISSPYQ